MNPLCACGCGREVSRPWHKYVLGHVRKPKLLPGDIVCIKYLLRRRKSQLAIGKCFGVSQTIVSQVAHGDFDRRITGQRRAPWEAAEIIRAGEIEERKRLAEADKKVRDARRALVALKSQLRSMKRAT